MKQSLIERLMITLVLLASFCGNPARGQDKYLIQWVPAPTFADSAWHLDLACAGVQPDSGGDLRDVKWFVGVWNPDSGIVSRWVPPDTILLMPIAYLSPLVVAHELMHHLLRGPGAIPYDSTVDTHPPTIFDRCQLMVYQYRAELNGDVKRIVGLWPRAWSGP